MRTEGQCEGTSTFYNVPQQQSHVIREFVATRDEAVLHGRIGLVQSTYCGP